MKTLFKITIVAILTLTTNAQDNGLPVSKAHLFTQSYTGKTSSDWRLYETPSGNMVAFNPKKEELWKNPVTDKYEPVKREWTEEERTAKTREKNLLGGEVINSDTASGKQYGNRTFLTKDGKNEVLLTPDNKAIEWGGKPTSIISALAGINGSSGLAKFKKPQVTTAPTKPITPQNEQSIKAENGANATKNGNRNYYRRKLTNLHNGHGTPTISWQWCKEGDSKWSPGICPHPSTKVHDKLVYQNTSETWKVKKSELRN